MKLTIFIHKIYLEFPMLLKLVFLLIFLAEYIGVDIFEPDPMFTSAFHPVWSLELPGYYDATR